jgi:predicted nucleic acid-binding protein
MKYVFDSCGAFKWVVAEVLTTEALRLRDDYGNAVHELIAPDVFPVEVGHALTRAERQGRINPSQAAVLWQDVMLTAPVLVPYLPLMPRAIELSSQFRIGVYDCLYVALAEREGCELVTADDRLVKTLGPQFPFVISLAAVP